MVRSALAAARGAPRPRARAPVRDYRSRRSRVRARHRCCRCCRSSPRPAGGPTAGLLMLIALAAAARRRLAGLVGGAARASSNDLITGAPIGLSVALWPAIMLALDIIDRRTMWRDYWIEWALAAMFIGLFVRRPVAGRGVGRRAGAASPMSRPSILVGILCFPVAAFLVGAARPLEAGAMKPTRFTGAHQSMTFSRRMMLVGGAQVALGGGADRPARLSVDQPERALQAASPRATASS